MLEYLNKIRERNLNVPIKKQILYSVAILCIGLLLGVLIKLFDFYTNYLGNIFSEISIWILIGTMVAVYSSTPKRASVNVFLLSSGMLLTYYITADMIGGVYSWTFIYGWSAFCLLSPIFAYIAWYAKGQGFVAKLLSVGIILVMLITTVVLFDKVRLSDIIIALITAFVLFSDKKIKTKDGGQ